MKGAKAEVPSSPPAAQLGLDLPQAGDRWRGKRGGYMVTIHGCYLRTEFTFGGQRFDDATWIVIYKSDRAMWQTKAAWQFFKERFVRLGPEEGA